MSNIRIDLDAAIYDGQNITFKSPCDCSAVTGLKVYYPNAEGVQSSQIFAFADAHGNDVGTIDELFAENVLVKVILDTTTNKAFVQNADTNAYLENKFKELNKPTGTYTGNGSDTSRKIDIGGTGNVLLITGFATTALVWENGAVVFTIKMDEVGETTYLSTDSIKFYNGFLHLETYGYLNISGVSYTYQVL